MTTGNIKPGAGPASCIAVMLEAIPRHRSPVINVTVRHVAPGEQILQSKRTELLSS